ncbi:family 16 glycosylhydrolase [Reichenbachiella carrageenanivorans]|uniref:Family 16 glycosylhydrolase n=1 Tax=Reichenbachiella carrageenanivorans TaxID=2979869 RepID=A0ABY6D0D9_9BACT|nr:family 16 glycosylhydrolase [Reichenbachiella carrageenanivorans]UXX79374.1 family 16 glycosylhydrolase [Reichenbachiella carrageenanivorans]
MREISFVIILTLLQGYSLQAQKPEAHTDMAWDYLSDYSDEFNTGTLDAAKWNNNVGDWGTWSWEPENAYVKDTVLALQMKHDPHQRGGVNYYFTSGIVQITKKITYGYFEAKIKACQNWPGEAPAFWLYSQGEPTPTEEGGVQYSEIDAVEIFQIVGELKTIEMNLHTRIIKDGELTWIRPGQGYEEMTRNTWEAPWDPRDDYHTYGVMNRKDSIIWYVDGVERGRKANLYWHLPMNVTVSMGLRNPYEKYINGVRTVIETPTSPVGFPTEMYCDYVRVWEAPAQIVVDRDKIAKKEYSPSFPIIFDYAYDAGSGYEIPSDAEGLVLRLQQQDASGAMIKEYKTIDASIAGRVAGESSVTLALPDDILLTSKLPSGHSYVLLAETTSTIGGGTTVTMEEIKDINVTDLVLDVSGEPSTGLAVFPNPATNQLSIRGEIAPDAQFVVYNLLGVEQVRAKLPRQAKNGVSTIDISPLHAGVYLLVVKSSDHSSVIRFAKN